jgi:hypothetical protein
MLKYGFFLISTILGRGVFGIAFLEKATLKKTNSPKSFLGQSSMQIQNEIFL